MEPPSQGPGAFVQGAGQPPVADGHVQIQASDLSMHRRPSRCGLRVWLFENGTPVGPPSPFEEAVRRLGLRHEVEVLTGLQPVVNLSSGTLEQRAQWTRDELDKGAAVVYRGVLLHEIELAGGPATVVATPDFLVKTASGYSIRAARLSGAASQQKNLDVLLRLQLEGWLLREALEQEPVALEIAAGDGSLVGVVDDRGAQALGQLAHLARIKRLAAAPYEPVGWLKCHACPFVRRCWPEAVARKDVSCLPNLDERLIRALHEHGADTVDQLIEGFDQEALAATLAEAGINRPELAVEVLRGARAFASGRAELHATPDLLLSDNYVVFDCEGLPPQFDEFDRIYIWGMRVFGTLPSPYTAAMATGEPAGDEVGWRGFLAEVAALFDYYGDIPFVHWLPDERRSVQRYVARHGDPDGIAARVLRNLVDLEPVVRASAALPLPANTLRVVSRFAGLATEDDHYGRDWALAKYIEVVENADEMQRAGLVGQVQAANNNDLEATYAVLKWLLARAAEPRAPIAG